MIVFLSFLLISLILSFQVIFPPLLRFPFLKIPCSPFVILKKAIFLKLNKGRLHVPIVKERTTKTEFPKCLQHSKRV